MHNADTDGTCSCPFQLLSQMRPHSAPHITAGAHLIRLQAISLHTIARFIRSNLMAIGQWATLVLFGIALIIGMSSLFSLTFDGLGVILGVLWLLLALFIALKK